MRYSSQAGPTTFPATSQRSWGHPATRICWPGAGRFRVSLHSAISGRPLQIIVDRTGVGSDVAFLEDEPRVSYLVIESENVDWSTTLEEAVAR